LKLNGVADTVGTLMVAGGTLSTGGFSAGRLTAGNISFNAASTLATKLVDAANSDRITVNGTVAVGGTLQLSLSSAVAARTAITLIDTDGTAAITGNFAGLPQGAVLNVGGQAFAISYTGGDGNDVTLTTVTPADVGVVKSGPSAVVAGTSATYTITVTNN